jgi:hypothetical protein
MQIKRSAKQIPYWILQIILPALVYGFILVFRAIPQVFRPSSLTLRYGTTTVILAVGILSFLVLCIQNRWKNVILATWTLALFAFALNGQWASGQSDGWAAGGLLPWADGGTYYYNALRLIQGWNIYSSAARRPLYPIYLSMMLRLAGGNLMVSLALEAALIGISTFMLIRELRKWFGPAPTAMALLLLFMFVRRFTGQTGTESLAYPVSLFGYALLFHSVRQEKKAYAQAETWTSLGLLALAQMVRPGAMFILPGLVIWIGFFFRGSRRFSFSTAGIALGIVVVAFLINSAVFSTFAAPGTMMNDSWSWSIYGIAKGGKGFSQHEIDFPQCEKVSDAECSSMVMQGAVDEILHHPQNLAIGIGKTYAALFSSGYNNLFSYATFSYADNIRAIQDRIVEWIFFGLFFIGLVTCCIRIKNPIYLALVLATFGVFLSVPFAPPTESNRMRLYTSSILITILPVSIGIDALLQILVRWQPIRAWGVRFLQALAPEERKSLSSFPSSRWAWVGVSIVLFGFALPYTINVFAKIKPTSLFELSCPAGMSAVVINYQPENALHVDPEPQFFLDWVPRLHEGRFDKGLHASGSQEALKPFFDIEAPAIITHSLALNTGGDIWVASQPDLLQGKSGLLGLCGKPGTYDSFPFFYPREVRSLASQ